MKYLLLIPLFLFSLFVAHPVNAQTPPITPTLFFCVGNNPQPPCATIPPSQPPTTPPTIIPTTIPSISPGTSAMPSSTVTEGINPSVSPAPTSTPPASTPGTNQICTNFSQFLNKINPPQQTNSAKNAKIHIKCHGGGGGNGGGNGGGINPNNGWLSKFITLLIQLLLQLLQLCGVPQPGTGAPVPSGSPSLVPSVAPSGSVSTPPSTSTAPVSGSPTNGQTTPPASTSTAPAPTTPVTSSSCTNPSHVIQMDPNNVQNGITLDKYYLSADTWNAKGFNITQTVYVCNYNNWYVVAGNMSEAGGVKSYPNVHEDFKNVAISSFKTVSSTFASTSPRVGVYDAAYDIWINNMSTELMVWTESYNQTLNGLNPPGSKQTVTLGGRSYDVYKGSGSGYIAFKATTPFDSGTVDLLGIFKYMISQGWIASNSTLGQIDYGIEFVSTNNQNVTFKVTNFSITTN